MESTFMIGGDLEVGRLGFGAMRITGPGILGWPHDRDAAKRLIERVVELGIRFIDTADAYGPETSEYLIAQALHPASKISTLLASSKSMLSPPLLRRPAQGP